MRIFIDCTHTADQPHLNTGIQRVVRQLLSGLKTISDHQENLEIIPVKFNGVFISRALNVAVNLKYPDQPLHTSTPKHKTNIVTDVISVLNKNIPKVKRKLLTLLFYIPPLKLLRAKVKFSKFEQVAFSNNDIYLIADANWNLSIDYYLFLTNLKANNVQVSSICYDLIPIMFPDLCEHKFVAAFSKFYALYSHLFDRVICISAKVAEDYIMVRNNQLSAKVNPNQIVKSFKLGAEFVNKNLIAKNLGDLYPMLNRPYILVVGSIVPHKNPESIINAFELLLKANPNLQLIFVGLRGWHQDTNKIIDNHKLFNQSIHILDAISDCELDYLYQNCYCLVQASFYEGFGLPLVEALQHGKPVISSTGGSLPEVGGEFSLYFNPNNYQELYECLSRLLSSEEGYNQLVNRIIAEYKPTSWQDSAQQVFDILIS